MIAGSERGRHIGRGRGREKAQCMRLLCLWLSVMTTVGEVQLINPFTDKCNAPTQIDKAPDVTSPSQPPVTPANLPTVSHLLVCPLVTTSGLPPGHTSWPAPLPHLMSPVLAYPLSHLLDCSPQHLQASPPVTPPGLPLCHTLWLAPL